MNKYSAYLNGERMVTCIAPDYKAARKHLAEQYPEAEITHLKMEAGALRRAWG